MMPPPQWRPEQPAKEASRALLSGFAGCLGVGLALIFVFFVFFVVVALLSHH